MTNLAVTIPMFSRVKKLSNLFNSIEKSTNVSQVYVADNGKMNGTKESLYNKNYEFKLDIFDLEYDSGVGNCRKELVERTTEDFLLFIDPDMYMPNNYALMMDLMEYNEDIGGISGLLINSGRIRTTASDIEEHDDIVYRIIRERERHVEYCGGNIPFISFDFIPQTGIFRRDCLEDYAWDRFYKTNGEHLDFFMGHKRKTDWEFGICPEIVFPHFPGGSQEYENRRNSQETIDKMYNHFHEKWGTKEVKTVCDNFVDTYPYHLTQYERLKFYHQTEGTKKTFEKVLKYFLSKF